MLGHIPLPAKITIETLPAIDLRKEFGADPDVDEIYDHLIRLMQDTLDALAVRAPAAGARMRVSAEHEIRRRSTACGRSSPTPSGCSASCRG